MCVPRFLPALLFLALLAPLGCGGNGSDSGDMTGGSGMGTLRVLLTDGPADELSSVEVYISGFKVKPSGGDVQRIASDVGLVDLLTLKDVNRLLLTAGITPGDYEFIMIDLDQDRSYVVVKATGAQEPLKIPSEEIKVLGGFTVGPSLTTTITLDFDADKSLIKEGNGQWLLKPVIIQTQVTGPS